MAEQFPQPHSFTQPGIVMPIAGVPPRWLRAEDDLALGCESADPSLQIEHWGQEVLQFRPSSS
jgi:hypothetical protein